MPTDPVVLADMLQKYGPWGIIAVLLVAIAYLHRGWQGCQDIALRDRERLVTALEATKDASERFETTLQSIRALLDTRNLSVIDLAHQVQLITEKMQHGFGNVSQSFEALLRLIDRERDRGRP